MPAVSRRRSNVGLAEEESFEGFAGGEVAQDGSGAFVEFFGDGVQVGLMGGDVLALGDVLTDQAVGVLVAGTLPGAVWIGEVHRQVGGDGQRGVAGHLAALIPSQRGASFRVGR